MARAHDASPLAAIHDYHEPPEAPPPLGDLLELGFVVQLCLVAFDLEQSLQLACRFSLLWSRRRFHYERRARSVRVYTRPSDQEGKTRFDPVESTLRWCQLIARLSAGSTAPLKIEAPASAWARLTRLLDCPIHPVDDELALHLESIDVQRPNPQYDATLVHLLTAHGEQCLSALATVHSTRAKAKHVLSRITASGATVRIDPVAHELGLTSRTLHRKLRAEGTSFRALVAEHKLQLCLGQLARASTSAKQVAYDLGFADPASFHRAFKRWTGRTVSQYRGRQALESRGEGP